MCVFKIYNDILKYRKQMLYESVKCCILQGAFWAIMITDPMIIIKSPHDMG